MLAVAILQVLGLTALGALVGIIATPFILYLVYIIAYALASIIAVLILKKRTLGKGLMRFQQFVNPVNAIIHHSNNKQATVCYAKPIPDLRDNSNGIVDRHIMSQSQMPPKPSTTKCQTANHNTLDTVNQPIVKNTLKPLGNIFHRIISFYMSFYGHSTKVEKNPLVFTMSYEQL